MNFVPLMAVVAEDGQSTGLQWWFWLILIVVIVAIFLWLWLSGKKPTSDAVEEKKEIAEPLPAKVETVEVPVPLITKTLSVPESFVIIEGIGPKINQVLHDAGINSFADLAETDAEKLKQVLLDAKLRLADPTSWPAQAALVRDGKMDELKALQERLTAGRS